MRTGPTRREVLTSLCGTTAAVAAAETGAATRAATTQQTPGGNSWPMFGHDEANTGSNPAATGPTTDVGPAWTFDTGGQINTSAAVVDGTVYVGSRDETVYALSGATGIEEWQFTADSDVRSSPAVADVNADGDGGSGLASGRTVYVGSEDGTIYAIDADSGDLVWRFGTGDTVRSSPVVAGGVVYVGSRDNTVYAIDAIDGTERWQFETGWFVDSSPAVSDGTVYVGSDDGNVYALDAERGEKRWEFTTGDRVPSSPAVVGDTVYVGSLDQAVYALDAEGGEKRWEFDTGGAVTSSPAVVADNPGSTDAVADTVYVTSRSNRLYALDAEGGEKRWEFDTGRPIRGSPAVAAETVYVGSTSNSVFGIDAGNGDELWEFDTGRPVSATPTAVDGTVYVGSENQRFYALEDGFAESPTPTPTPAGSEGTGFTFLLLPATVVGAVALLVGSLYAAKRAGLFEVPPPPDVDESPEDGGPDGDPGTDSPSELWELMIDDVIARATETRKAATQDVVVTKHVDEGTLASPVIAYEIESLRQEPARVRLTEPLLEADDDSSQPMGNGWTVEGDQLVYETVVEPGSTASTLVGRRDCPPDRADELLDRPDVHVDPA